MKNSLKFTSVAREFDEKASPTEDYIVREFDLKFTNLKILKKSYSSKN